MHGFHDTGIGMAHREGFALPRVTFLVGGKQYGRVGWRVSESPIITYVYRLTGVPSTGGSAIVYTQV